MDAIIFNVLISIIKKMNYTKIPTGIMSHQKKIVMKTTFSIKDLIQILSLIISISLPLGYAYMMKMNELV